MAKHNGTEANVYLQKNEKKYDNDDNEIMMNGEEMNKSKNKKVTAENAQNGAIADDDGAYLHTFDLPYDIECAKCFEVLNENSKYERVLLNSVGLYRNTKIYQLSVNCFYCKNEIKFVNDPITNNFVCTEGARKISDNEVIMKSKGPTEREYIENARENSERSANESKNNINHNYDNNKHMNNYNLILSKNGECRESAEDKGKKRREIVEAAEDSHEEAKKKLVTYVQNVNGNEESNTTPIYADKALDAYRDVTVEKRACLDERIGIPFSNETQIMLTDYYQISMCYVYWKNNIHKQTATFELYFRKCPFNGEFAIFAGVNELLRFINTFKFLKKQLLFLKGKLPKLEDEFFEYLASIDGSELTIHGVLEGKMVFGGEPLIRVEGPLGVCQLIETTVVNTLNFATLVTTNAARFRLAAGWDKTLLEFGARRAQGGDGAMSASRYAYMGGFDATSNLRAGYLFDIPLKGTHAHSFVTSFSISDINGVRGQPIGNCDDFRSLVLKMREKICSVWPKRSLATNMHRGELAAFIAYAQAFPDSCVCLVDTYDTLLSGVPNFLCVALALKELNFEPIGVRLDSGDLAYLSKEIRGMFREVSAKLEVDLSGLKIAASNDINESVLKSLKEQDHEIDVFGIGTNLVTCQAQPALGMVYKLVELMGVPCMKLSQELSKSSLPAKKNLFRFYLKNGEPIADFIQLVGKERVPACDELILCRHIYDDVKRCHIIPSKVEDLLVLLFKDGKAVATIDDLHQCRLRALSELKQFRPDHLRPVNPTPYKVSVSAEYFDFFRKLWDEKAPQVFIVSMLARKPTC